MAEHFQAFSHAVWWIADNAVENPRCSDRSVGEIRNKAIAEAFLEIILLEICDEPCLAFSSYTPTIYVAAPCRRSKMGTCYRKASRADERIVEHFPRSCERDIRCD